MPASRSQHNVIEMLSTKGTDDTLQEIILLSISQLTSSLAAAVISSYSVSASL